MNTIYLSAENFIKVLQGEVATDQSGVEHSFLHDNAVMLQADLKKRYIIVKEDIAIGADFQFDKHIEISNVECQNITIDGATFHRNVYIHNGAFQNITIKNGSFEEFVMYGGSLSNLYLSGQNDMQECVIKGVSCYHITVDDGRYQKYFEIDQAKIKGYITISGGNFEGSYGESLSITDNEIEGAFTVSGGIYATSTKIDNNKVREIEIKGGEFKKNVTLQGTNFNSSCLIEGGTFRNEFLITKANLSKLTVNSSFSKLKLEDTHIKECMFSEEINYPLKSFMTLQYLSDLHLEFPANQHWLNERPISPEGDVLIIAGDTHPLGNSFERLRVWDYFSKNFRETYVLPGNHEYYGGFDVASSLAETKRPIKKNVWLVNNCVVEKPEVRLVFTTLWSRIEKNIAGVLLGMRDFKRIRYQGKLIGINHYNHLHEVALKFLKNNLITDPQKPQIVVSHHLPSEHCNAEEFQGSTLNEAFCVDLTDFIEQSAVDAWIYGHSHRNVEAFTIGRTQMLTNQLGYVQLGEHTTFRENAGVALSD